MDYDAFTHLVTTAHDRFRSLDQQYSLACQWAVEAATPDDYHAALDLMREAEQQLRRVGQELAELERGFYHDAPGYVDINGIRHRVALRETPEEPPLVCHMCAEPGTDHDPLAEIVDRDGDHLLVHWDCRRPDHQLA